MLTPGWKSHVAQFQDTNMRRQALIQSMWPLYTMVRNLIQAKATTQTTFQFGGNY